MADRAHRSPVRTSLPGKTVGNQLVAVHGHGQLLVRFDLTPHQPISIKACGSYIYHKCAATDVLFQMLRHSCSGKGGHAAPC